MDLVAKAQYPTSQQEWDRWRPKITHLYGEEGQTLKEVMAFMEKEHLFKATEKMYKTKIKLWKLDKKNKREEVEAILHMKARRDAVGKKSLFILRGREVDLTNVARYIYRNRHKVNRSAPIKTPADLMEDLICLSPPQSPVPLPVVFETPEKLFHNSNAMVQIMFNTGRWRVQQNETCIWNPSFERDFKIMNLVESNFYNGTYEFSKSNCRLAWAYWRAGFRASSDIVTGWYNRTIHRILIMSKHLVDASHGSIAALLLDHVSATAKKLLPFNDLRRSIFESLSKIDLSQLSELVDRYLICFQSNLENILGSESPVVFEEHLCRAQQVLLKDSSVPIDSSIPKIAELDQSFGPSDALTLEALYLWASILGWRKLHAEAEKLWLELIQRTKSVKAHSRQVYECSGYFEAATSQFFQGKFDIARKNFIATLRVNEALFEECGVYRLRADENLEIFSRIRCIALQAGDDIEAKYWGGRMVRFHQKTLEEDRADLAAMELANAATNQGS